MPYTLNPLTGEFDYYQVATSGVTGVTDTTLTLTGTTLGLNLANPDVWTGQNQFTTVPTIFNSGTDIPPVISYASNYLLYSSGGSFTTGYPTAGTSYYYDAYTYKKDEN